MKAFIFNSGTGSRMGELTKENPKALVQLSNGESILGRQIRLLRESGIKDIIISTGPHESKIKDLTNKFSNINFQFVNNPIYKDTNSIYSLFLSKSMIDDDFIVLHGDLVFDTLILNRILEDDRQDLCLINKKVAQPEKDFKGRIINDILSEISVNIFDSNCYALQPLYKFSEQTMKLWINEIENYVINGQVKVYAENALNEILSDIKVSFFDYSENYIEEVDNPDDLSRVSSQFRLYDYKNQQIIISHSYIDEIKAYMNKKGLLRPLIVHGKHLLKDIEFNKLIASFGNNTFCGYSPNPTYDEVLVGLEKFKINKCDSIIAIGGGSCIDVAKAIKLYSVHDGDYINKGFVYVNLPLIVAPTTAGTGTESTRYSVIYYQGEKQSLVNDSLIPDLVILNELFLNDIPDYHKKSALLDAFCQAIESYWSINSNEQSKNYSEQALNIIVSNYKRYLVADKSVYKNILVAANYAGKAINITQTTAPHAMSYKITTLKGVSHGHAVSIVLPFVMKYMQDNIHLCQDIRGVDHLKSIFESLRLLIKCNNNETLMNRIESIMNDFNLNYPSFNKNELQLLVSSVNETRLKNNPVFIDKQAIVEIFESIISKQS